MFGREAAEILDYVECFPDGYRKGIQIAKACKNVKIEGFPTWVINGQVIKYFHICIFPFIVPHKLFPTVIHGQSLASIGTQIFALVA